MTDYQIPAVLPPHAIAPSDAPRLDFITIALQNRPLSFCTYVVDGLSQPQKTLPCHLFYDAAGSDLFERITRLPDYYLTRTEQNLLSRHAGAIAAAAAPGINNVALVEFGSGSSLKTRIVIDALLARQPQLHYTPLDISGDFLRASALDLLGVYPNLTITALAAEYRDGMTHLPVHDGPRLILFLGSNIGNFAPSAAQEFLCGLRNVMQSDDRLLLGVDIIKPPSILEAAYNDPQGVTAQFNKNLLRRVNRELGGDFDLDGFAHAAPFVNEPNRARIEMRLVSLRRQHVTLREVERTFTFEAGEFIHTENSHKFALPEFETLAQSAGFAVAHCWQDTAFPFALLLLQPVPLSR